MSKKKKRRVRQQEPFHRPCLDFLEDEGTIKNIVMVHGLTMKVKMVMCGRIKKTLHIMFDDEMTGARVLNYWPGNGTWTTPEGKRGKANDRYELLGIVAEVVSCALSLPN